MRRYLEEHKKYNVGRDDQNCSWEDTNEMRSREIYLNLTYRCNNDCIFCAARLDKGECVPKDISICEFNKILTRIRIGNTDIGILNGGEPTLVNSLPEMIRTLSRIGARTILFTNGRKLSSLDYCRELLDDTRNLEIQVPIHGSNSEIHDSLTRRVGSFDEAVRGVSNLLGLKDDRMSIVVKTLMCSLNLSRLPETAGMIAKRFPSIDKFIISSLIYEGNVLQNIKDNHFSLRGAGVLIGHAILVCKDAGIPVFLNKVPACLLEEQEFLNTLNASQSGRRIEPDRMMIYFDSTILQKFPTGKKIKTYPQGKLPDECVLCKYYEVCPGLEETYFERYGGWVINPFKFPDERLISKG